MKFSNALVLIVCLFLSQVAIAGDAQAGRYHCPIQDPSHLLELNTDNLWREVEDRYDEALDISLSDKWIYSKSPVFTWATEAKIACARAIGYMKGGHVENEYVNKCDCFHKRMQTYIGNGWFNK